MIIKSSDGIRSRREGRGDEGVGGGEVSLMGSSSSSFLAGKSRKFKGRKVQNQARKMGQKNKKTKKQIPQGRKVSDAESQLGRWAEGLTCARLPACHQSARVRTWLCLLLSLSGF